jgi:hypothetical protein
MSLTISYPADSKSAKSTEATALISGKPIRSSAAGRLPQCGSTTQMDTHRASTVIIVPQDIGTSRGIEHIVAGLFLLVAAGLAVFSVRLPLFVERHLR